MTEPQAAGDWLDTLRDAHRQYASSAFADAARLYEKAAQAAEMSDLPTAYRLYLQAGRAALLADGTYQGTELLLRGLKLLALDGQTRLLEKHGALLVAELRGQGLNQTAQRVVTWLASGGLGAEAEPEMDSNLQTGHSPVYCPTCQGNLQAEELVGSSGQPARCPFCGFALPEGTG